jgi:DNA-binding transcriptional MerR regulator
MTLSAMTLSAMTLSDGQFLPPVDAPQGSQALGMSTRMAIGDFSKVTYLSVKALRRYHDMGLLVPASVDQGSGYRYYSAAQAAIGQVIRRFRDLGMPLERVKEILDAPDADSRNEVIVAHLHQMEKSLAQTHETVASLRTLLEQPRKGPVSVEYRSVAASAALAITVPVSMGGIGSWWGAAFSELQHTLGSSGALRNGPNGALYHGEIFEDGLGDVVAFIPVVGETMSGPVRLVETPAAEFAVTVHQGALSKLDQAYAMLGAFVAEREIGVQGPIRENYLVSYQDTDDESQLRTEVCWPVFHTKARNSSTR